MTNFNDFWKYFDFCRLRFGSTDLTFTERMINAISLYFWFGTTYDAEEEDEEFAMIMDKFYDIIDKFYNVADSREER